MGAEHARLLLSEGAKVVMGDILDDEGHSVAKELGDNAHYLHLDVTQPSSGHPRLPKQPAGSGGSTSW